MYEEIDAEPALWTPLRILQGVRVLHQRGFQGTRILPGMSSSGMYWRVSIAAAANFQTDGSVDLRDWDSAVNYSTGGGTEFAGSRVDASTSPDIVADLILSALPRLAAVDDDPLYVEWYAQPDATRRGASQSADRLCRLLRRKAWLGDRVGQPDPPPPPAGAADRVITASQADSRRLCG